jgi:pimeloyl-ACP methyl ester carboxylesterase
MKNKMLWLVVLAGVLCSTLAAQDISGDWQGTLKIAGQELRLIVHFEKGANGGWTANLYSIDQTTEPVPVDLVRGTYEGKLSADGTSIAGTWKQGLPLPLDLQRATKETAWQRDPSPHTVQFITVDANVKLEVLDWGGSGKPLVLLAGLGNTAHIFDKFALKLTASHHVYGVTRRGFGVSSSPPSGYSADRLGDDVLAVIDSLKLDHPVLIGHSIAGEELSSVGSRHPEKVAGLIYLDAGYAYAYYDRSRGDLVLDSIEVQNKMERLRSAFSVQERRQITQELLQTTLPQLEKDLQQTQKDLQPEPDSPGLPSKFPSLEASLAIRAGEQKYTDIRVPVLAIYALPHSRPDLATNATAQAAVEARDLENTGAQAKAFETGVPTARVVRLGKADHYVFVSNEADVLREINTYLAGLR